MELEILPDEAPKDVSDYAYELWVQTGRNIEKTVRLLREKEGDRPAFPNVRESQVRGWEKRLKWRQRQFEEAVHDYPENYALTREVIHRNSAASAVFLQDVREGRVTGDPRLIKLQVDAAKHLLGLGGHTIHIRIDPTTDSPAPVKDYEREIADLNEGDLRDYIRRISNLSGEIIDVEVIDGDDSGAPRGIAASSGTE